MRVSFSTGTNSSNFRSTRKLRARCTTNLCRRFLQRSEILLDVRAEILLHEHHATGESRAWPGSSGAKAKVRRIAGEGARSLDLASAVWLHRFLVGRSLNGTPNSSCVEAVGVGRRQLPG